MEAVGKTMAVPFSTADVGTRIPDDEEAQVAVAFSPLADWVLVGAKTKSVAVAVSTLLEVGTVALVGNSEKALVGTGSEIKDEVSVEKLAVSVNEAEALSVTD